MSVASSPELYGLVLTGGRSSRMGRDKSRLHYHGIPQYRFLLDLLSSTFCSKVFVSADRNSSAEDGVDIIFDQFGWQGPLNGILSGLFSHPGKAMLTVAVDMPAINRHLIEFLVANRAADQAATCFINPETGKPEPLCTIYEPGAADRMAEWVKSHAPAPRDFLIQHNCRMLQWNDASVFRNINTPDEYRNFTSGKISG